jgi:hypothetical protein
MDMNKINLFLNVQQSHDGQGITIGVVFKTKKNNFFVKQLFHLCLLHVCCHDDYHQAKPLQQKIHEGGSVKEAHLLQSILILIYSYITII